MQVNIATFADFVTPGDYLSLIGVRNVFPAPGFPYALVLTFFYASIEFDPSECGMFREFHTEIVDQDGKEIFKTDNIKQPINLELATGNGAVNLNLALMNFVIPAPGTYAANLFMGDQLIHTTRVYAVQR